MYVIKQKLNFEDDENFLEANQLEKEINLLEKNKLDIISLRENHKELIKQIIYIKIIGRI